MTEGEFEKRIDKIFPKIENLEGDGRALRDLDPEAKFVMGKWFKLIDEAKKELEQDSYKSWVSPAEPKPAIKYICIKHEKFVKWFGEEDKGI